MQSFLLKNSDRGYIKLPSTGSYASYVAGHPDGVIERRSSFNFHEYQSGIAGFGKVRVFGQEIFSPSAGYNIHPHHNFIIIALVLRGTLTHINTLGKPDQIHQDDFYVFSTGSGGKHSELNIENHNLEVFYIWLLPDKLLLPPLYLKSNYQREKEYNRFTLLIGENGLLPINQDIKLTRLCSDQGKKYVYQTKSIKHGVYFFLVKGMVSMTDTLLASGDSIGISGENKMNISVLSDQTDMLILETIM